MSANDDFIEELNKLVDGLVRGTVGQSTAVSRLASIKRQFPNGRFIGGDFRASKPWNQDTLNSLRKRYYSGTMSESFILHIAEVSESVHAVSRRIGCCILLVLFALLVYGGYWLVRGAVSWLSPSAESDQMSQSAISNGPVSGVPATEGVKSTQQSSAMSEPKSERSRETSPVEPAAKIEKFKEQSPTAPELKVDVSAEKSLAEPASKVEKVKEQSLAAAGLKVDVSAENPPVEPASKVEKVKEQSPAVPDLKEKFSAKKPLSEPAAKDEKVKEQSPAMPELKGDVSAEKPLAEPAAKVEKVQDPSSAVPGR